MLRSILVQEAVLLSSAKRVVEETTGLEVESEPVLRSRKQPDARWRVGDRVFVVEAKSGARSATVAEAIAQLQTYMQAFPDAAPLLVVPAMGEAGAEICQRSKINWVDALGNATIIDGPIRVYVRGCRGDLPFAMKAGENRINPFGRKASRVSHALLTNNKANWTRAEIERITQLDKGYVSKVITALSERQLVSESSNGHTRTVNVNDPFVLLDAWSEHYKYIKPTLWGLIAARDGFEATNQLVELFDSLNIEYALTGLPAAAAFTSFGAFRRIDVYIDETPPDDLLAQVHISGEGRGRNVALRFDAAGASIGASIRNGLRVASPVLTYLDLAALPERAEEAREEMRRYLELQWR